LEKVAVMLVVGAEKHQMATLIEYHQLKIKGVNVGLILTKSV
jgi:hypothetical protein